MIAFIVHLIRHGEVENPDNVVYASLPGFGLSKTGRAQARAAAERVERRPIADVISSPLQRTVETADIVAARLGLSPRRDERVREWDLGERWAGIPWSELEGRFPGELEAYVDHPHDLPFADEPLEVLADRVAAVLTELAAEHEGAEVAIVSHQDPIQAARLALTGRSLSTLQSDKPGHGSIVTLVRNAAARRWREAGYWQPDQETTFPPVSSKE